MAKQKIRQSEIDAAAFPVRLLVRRTREVTTIDEDPDIALVRMFPAADTATWLHTGQVRAVYFRRLPDAVAWLESVSNFVELADGTQSENYLDPRRRYG